jgi:hypothetical protein
MNNIKLRNGILLLLFLLNSSVFAQDFCSTSSNIPDFLQNIPKSQYILPASDSYVVRVFFHIIRRSDGTGGQTQSEVNTAFNILKADYQPYGICFELMGIDEINDNDYYNVNINFVCNNSTGNTDCDNDGKFDNFHPNSHSNAIDIYLFANEKLNSGLAAGIPARALVIGGSAYGINLASSHVLSHEMGHCLGLYHTFHGLCNNEVGCAELVDGSNCTSCGDFVCDTPADPQTHQVNKNTCTWNGLTCGGVPNGNTYNPRTDLLMAYLPPNCMLVHTDGQVARMKAMIANSGILQQVLLPNNLTLSGIAIIPYEYKAHIRITSHQKIYSILTKYKASETILNPGFEVKIGSEFEVVNTDNCD